MSEAQTSIADAMPSTTVEPTAPVASGVDTVLASDGAPDYSWLGTGVDPDNAGWAQTKGFKDIDSMIKSHRSAESYIGMDPSQIIKMPKDGETMDAVWERLGRPETADGYKFDGQENYTDSPLVNLLKEVGHKGGMTSATYTELASRAVELANAEQAQAEESRVEAFNNEANQMKTDWGAKYDEVIHVADSAVRALGVDDETRDQIMQVMGPRKTVEFFTELHKHIGEDSVNSILNQESYGTTPEQIDHEITSLMKAVGNDKVRFDQYQTKSGSDYDRHQTLKNSRASLYDL